MTNRSPIRPPSTSLVDRALLHDLLATVERELEATGPGHGLLGLALEGVDDDGVDVATCTYDTDDVVATLAGLVAPASWLAFGVVCEGRAHATDASCRPLHPPPPGSPERVRFGVLVDRGGLSVAGLRRPGGPFERLPDEPALGRVPDACRRVLGLPTGPPTVPIDELFTTWWLDRVLEASLSSPGSLGWVEAAMLHPGHTTTIHDNGTDAALDAARAEAAAVTWDRLRQLVADSPAADRLVPPDLAAWMDAGMFSRELLSAFPDRATLLTDLEPTIAPAVAEGLRRTLDRWDGP